MPKISEENRLDLQKELRKHELLIPAYRPTFWCMCGHKGETKFSRERHIAEVIIEYANRENDDLTQDNHRLLSTVQVTETYGEYLCSCGARGCTRMARHLVGIFTIKNRLVTNHELHATRARIREKRG